MNEIKKDLYKVSEIVKTAGNIIKERLGSNFWTSYKSCPADLVTEVDRQSQSFIIKSLESAFPKYCIVAEEDFRDEELPLEGTVWYIDPLDGTTNFVFGVPICAVSVALAIDSRPVMGAIYDPFREELFTSAKGEGSYLNGKKIFVDSKRSSVNESLITTGFPSILGIRNKVCKDNFDKVLQKALDIRALGTAALELAYIACGRMTGYWEFSLRPWDVAAGMLMVEEAGGKVSDLHGNKLVLSNNISITASNGLIHDELINEFNQT